MMEILKKVGNFILDCAMSMGMKILIALVILVIGLWLRKWLIKIVTNNKFFHKLDVSLQTFLKSLLSLMLYIVLFLVIASLLGIPTPSFITLLASAGVAVSLALQGALSNFAGGIMLLFYHPFRVGDYVTAGAATGVVKEIAIFHTVVVTDDGKRVTLPNGTLTNAPITNFTREQFRRVDLTFTVPATNDIENIKKLLLETVGTVEGVLDTPAAPLARMNKQVGANMDFVVQVWVASENYYTVYYDLTEAVKKKFDASL